jgi:hypothetical protein
MSLNITNNARSMLDQVFENQDFAEEFMGRALALNNLDLQESIGEIAGPIFNLYGDEGRLQGLLEDKELMAHFSKIVRILSESNAASSVFTAAVGSQARGEEDGLPEGYEALVHPSITVDEFVETNFKFHPMREDVRGLRRFGDRIHNVRGNGDCGLTAFTTGVLYKLNGDQNLAGRLTELILTLNEPARVGDIEELLGPLSQIGERRNDDFRDGYLMNPSFISAFTRVLRSIGAREMQHHMHLETGLSLEEVSAIVEANTFPSNPGNEVSIIGLDLLAQRLQLRIATAMVLSRTDFTFSREDEDPDLVILLNPGHFFALIPSKLTDAPHDQLNQIVTHVGRCAIQ